MASAMAWPLSSTKTVTVGMPFFGASGVRAPAASVCVPVPTTSWAAMSVWMSSAVASSAKAMPGAATSEAVSRMEAAMRPQRAVVLIPWSPRTPVRDGRFRAFASIARYDLRSTTLSHCTTCSAHMRRYTYAHYDTHIISQRSAHGACTNRAAQPGDTPLPAHAWTGRRPVFLPSARAGRGVSPGRTSCPPRLSGNRFDD